MRMVIGGACQGKRRYAENLYPDTEWIDGETCELEAVFQCQGIVEFQIYIRRWLEAGKEPETLTAEIIRRNPELIIVSSEIGCGLVPVGEQERRYRECTGRICTELAAHAHRVDRVVCGIGMQIK